MIRIVVDNDRIGIPIPVAAVADLIGENTEVPTIEPESGWAATAQMVNVTGAEAAREVAVFEGMIQVETRIVRCRVTDPFVISGMHVRGVWMSVGVSIIVFLRGRTRFSPGRSSMLPAARRRGAMRWNVAAPNLRVPTTSMLLVLWRASRHSSQQGRDGSYQQRRRKKSDAVFQICLRCPAYSPVWLFAKPARLPGPQRRLQIGTTFGLSRIPRRSGTGHSQGQWARV